MMHNTLASSSIPTVEYASRAEVSPYLGFRHITGIKKWEPFPRARYVAQLIQDSGNIGDVEESVGDTETTVRHLYRSYLVYMQLRDMGFDTRPVVARFSLLEVTLNQASVKTFLGMSQKLPSVPVQTIVPDEHLSDLRDVITWVFGDTGSGVLPVITESREISNKLGPVLKDAAATDHLRTNSRHRGCIRVVWGRARVPIAPTSNSTARTPARGDGPPVSQ